MIEIKDGQFVCRYKEYLRWSRLTARTGEDVFTTIYLAYQDTLQNVDSFSFGWKPILATNSIRVSNILNQGLADLHFHLLGSSLNFTVGWLCLMNNLSETNYSNLRLLGKNDNLFQIVAKAAAIRIFLYELLFTANSEETAWSEYGIPLRQLLQSTSDAEVIGMMSQFGCRIDANKSLYGFKLEDGPIDYAIPKTISESDRRRYANIVLIGERRLLYRAFKKIYRTDNTGELNISRFLYVYILAKNKFRNALILNNGLKGFSNFQLFEHRKSLFANGKIYKSLIPFLSVHSIKMNQPISKLEMRIRPCEKVSDLRKNIRAINNAIDSTELLCGSETVVTPNFKKNGLGYILHFIKSAEKDDHSSDKSSPNEMPLRCRNHSLRMRLENEAKSVVQILEDGISVSGEEQGITDESCRIIGIDAAGSEFNARAEVFGSVFRRLKQVRREKKSELFHSYDGTALGCTFHVGEDFYDIVDGLRAIDEALIFLNLDHGDRIGHAVALGLEASDYYQRRDNIIVLPKQVLLDNIAWLLFNMDALSIYGEEGLRGKLQNKFRSLITEIYPDGTIGEGRSNITYLEYYKSWLLRGDNPFRTRHEVQRQGSDLFEKNKTADVCTARRDLTAVDLFIDYHYNVDVKRWGVQMEEWIVSNSCYPIIAKIQKRILSEIADRDIAIETPPTSNLKITDVERYAEHPIVKFNNYYLEPNDTDNAQISVSINTDDQGVFSTSLEKEYTLMALALEKEGRYRREDIYQWLDHVREMAHWYSFLK
ncbi:MAG: hypothetical protein IJ764_04670 [Bacteroidales bacterium]|nr:hypothetical protein [Bacteroidales bacterium]